MLPIAAFALLAFAGLGLSSVMPGPDTDEPDDMDTPETPDVTDPDEPVDPDDPVDPPITEPTAVASDSTLVGTDGDDSYILADATTDTSNITIDAGAGADTIELSIDADGNLPQDLQNESWTISGGDGDDLIFASAARLNIDGGAGDDTIGAPGNATGNIYGGDGNDTLSGSQSSSDPLNLFGGAGDDVMDGSKIENGRFSGGDGDDDITFAGTNDGGAGYAVSANGDAGNDTMRYNGGAILNGFGAPTISGGDGEDTFMLTLNEGFGTPDDTFATADDGTAQFASVNIGDFENGEDIIIVDGTATSDDFTLATARLETLLDRFDEPYSALILRFESDDEEAREAVVGLGSGEVTLNSVAFTGDQTPATFTDRR